MWIILTACLAASNPVMDDAKNTDLQNMQGEWGCTLNIRAGQRQPDEVAESLFRDVKDDVMSISLYDRVLQKAKIKLNPNVTPKQIDQTALDGPAKDKVSQGIYEFKDGVLRICMAPPGEARPTAFESKEGSKLSLTEWKQNKK